MADRGIFPQSTEMTFDASGYEWLLRNLHNMILINEEKELKISDASITFLAHNFKYDQDKFMLGMFYFLLCAREQIARFVGVPVDMKETPLVALASLLSLTTMSRETSLECLDYLLDHTHEVDHPQAFSLLEDMIEKVDLMPDIERTTRSIRDGFPLIKWSVESGLIKLPEGISS